MQSLHQSKVENMAGRIYETGHTYTPGDEVIWNTPSYYNTSDTIQRSEQATLEDCAEAKKLASQWADRRA